MIKHVASLGQNALAITDHESLSGHVKFIKEVKRLKKEKVIPQDFKPILGNEIYLIQEDEMNNCLETREKIKFYHFLLLAKDAIGHKQLRQLSSRAWERMFSYRGMDRVPTFHSDIEEVLSENKGHIIATSACLGSYFAQNVLALINENCEDKMLYKEKIHEFVTWCIDVFGKDDFYIEIQPSKESIEQIEYNKMAIKIAKAYGLNFLISTDAHYIQIEDRGIHKAYLTSDEEDGGDREVDAFYHSTHFFSAEMLMDYLDYLNEEDIVHGAKSTLDIVDKVEDYDLAHKQIIPKIKLPDKSEWFYDGELYSKAKKYSSIKGMIDSNEEYDKYLVSLTLKGIKEKIDKNDYSDTFERVNTECKEIIEISEAKKEPVSSYFVTMEKNIDLIWEEAESVVGTSRGSAAGFVVNYLIGITQINPLNQGVEMPHWRFITGKRPDFPDVDVDVSSHKRDIVFRCLSNYYESIGGRVVRVSTFGTETAKSTILTACRGLKINNDIGLYLSSLIPTERGFVWSIEDCYYGDEDAGRQVVHEFKNTVDKHEGLLEVALGIQGLINKRSSHPCGIIIVNEDFTEHNAIMRTPSKEIVSQYNLEDCEYVGNIKYDLLNTKTCGMIQKTLEMLVEHNKIEWQGSLRKTYDKYLHPDNLDKESPELWGLLHRGELISAFQFDSPVGSQALRLIKPTNLLEATNANNLMRLMGEDGREQPLDMYVRYKNNINEWYEDMQSFGLKEQEIETMKRHLLQDYGVCSSQERMMLISMDEDVAGFDVVESNVLRKSVAKKKKELLIQSEEDLYKKGLKHNVSKKLLQYVWDVQIAMQRGYGFSVLHGIGYTYILIQQLNLVYYYPPIFWNTAVLLVESGALEQDELDSEADEIESLKDRKEKTTNYGTVAKAIGNMQSQGVKIALPNINVADLGFKPDEENNQIVFGLKGIMRISNDISRMIMESRPFASLDDFHKRMVLTKREVTLSTGRLQNKSFVSDSQLIMLIKAGSFDELESKPREDILTDYLRKINPYKNAINAKGIERVIELGIIPQDYSDEIRFYNFRKYINENAKVQDEASKSIKWHSLSNGDSNTNDYATNFFHDFFASGMTEGKDYYYDDDGIAYVAMGTDRKGSFGSVYKEKMEKFNVWLQSEDCLEKYNRHLFDEVKREFVKGDISTYEMESMNFYANGRHELDKADLDKYEVKDFSELPEEPLIIGFTQYKGLDYPKFALTRIAGTVLDKDKTKHSIALLTPTGVVQVKFYSGQFSFYDQQLSVEKEDGKGKTVLEESWFKRGTKMVISGFRRQDQFKPKRYKSSVFQHTVQKIIDIAEDGDLVLQSERRREDEN